MSQPNAWLDEDGYPTKECLDAVTNGSSFTVFGILEAAWKFDGVSQKLRPEEKKLVGKSIYDPPGTYWRFATGGWSGNEDLIEAFEMNRWVWSMTWRMSAHGGLHIFDVPPFQIDPL